MKSLITLIALVVSMNSYASSFLATGTSGAQSTTSAVDKEAAEAMVNAEEFRVSGKLAPSLARQVADLQSQADLSIEEAVDLIVDNAAEILR